MDILITDITRMQNDHICVAGIEAGTGRRIRPVIKGQLPSSLLVTAGGPVDFRRVLHFSNAAPCGSNPEVEDFLVDFNEVEVLGSVSPTRFIEILRNNAVDLGAIGSDLIQRNRSLVTPEGKGACSLALIKAPNGIEFFFNSNGKLRFRWIGGIDLSVTDVRPYESDLMTPFLGAVDWMRNELMKKQEAFLCFGLTRPFRGYHWLQLNSIHFASAPAWTIASPPW